MLVLRTRLKGYVLLHAFRAGAEQHPASSAIISLAQSAHNFAALVDDCQEVMRNGHTSEPRFQVLFSAARWCAHPSRCSPEPCRNITVAMQEPDTDRARCATPGILELRHHPWCRRRNLQKLAVETLHCIF